MSNYNQEQFENDLNELTNLINKYSAEGGKKHGKKRSGKKSGKRSGKSGRKSGGARKGVRLLDAYGDPIRTFRVIMVNGKDVDGNKDYGQRYYKGTKKKNTPGKAADHAFPKLCKHTGQRNKSSCKVTFTLLETTKGGQHKEHSPYVGTYKKIPPKKVRRRNPKTGKVTEYTSEYKTD